MVGCDERWSSHPFGLGFRRREVPHAKPVNIDEALSRAIIREIGENSPTFGGLTLIAAGLYQWTPLKDACLRQCQFPLQFVQRHGGFRADAIGSLKLGARHGVYCIGCCWMLMTLLFVGGVMNVFWIALISIFVLTEKVVPVGRLISRLAGTLFLAVGVWLISSSMR